MVWSFVASASAVTPRLADSKKSVTKNKEATSKQKNKPPSMPNVWHSYGYEPSRNTVEKSNQISSSEFSSGGGGDFGGGGASDSWGD